MLNESDIQKLLRLKRHEQPPPEYFEQFLRDFHRRQRADMLRQPAWKIAMERLAAFFSEHSMPRYAYSMATATVLLFAGIISFNILNSGGPAQSVAVQSQSHNQTPSAAIIATQQANISIDNNQTRIPSLPGLNDINKQDSRTAQNVSRPANRPRYVIDSRPASASYERPFSF